LELKFSIFFGVDEGFFDILLVDDELGFYEIVFWSCSSDVGGSWVYGYGVFLYIIGDFWMGECDDFFFWSDLNCFCWGSDDVSYGIDTEAVEGVGGVFSE